MKKKIKKHTKEVKPQNKPAIKPEAKPEVKPQEKDWKPLKAIQDVIKDIRHRQTKKGQGRKYFDDKDPAYVLEKLEEVWAIDGTDAEASFFADIDPATLTRLLKEYPVIVQRKTALKNNPVLKARRVVVEGITNYDNAMKYLKIKKSDEFKEAPTALINNTNIAGVSNDGKGKYAGLDRRRLEDLFKRRRLVADD